MPGSPGCRRGPRGVEIGDGVDVRRDRRRIEVVEFREEAAEIRAGRIRVLARRINLRPVARRQHHRLARQPALRHGPQGVRDPACLEVDALAQLLETANGEVPVILHAAGERMQMPGGISQAAYVRGALESIFARRGVRFGPLDEVPL